MVDREISEMFVFSNVAEFNVVGTGAKAAELLIASRGAAFTQMGFRQLLIFDKELSQDEVNDVLRAMFPA